MKTTLLALAALLFAPTASADEVHVIRVEMECEGQDGSVLLPKTDQPLIGMTVTSCVAGNCLGGVRIWPIVDERVPLVDDFVELLTSRHFDDPQFLALFQGTGSLVLPMSRYGVDGLGFCIGARIYVRYEFAPDVFEPPEPDGGGVPIRFRREDAVPGGVS